jgi:hypothetical protein
VICSRSVLRATWCVRRANVVALGVTSGACVAAAKNSYEEAVSPKVNIAFCERVRRPNRRTLLYFHANICRDQMSVPGGPMMRQSPG